MKRLVSLAALALALGGTARGVEVDTESFNQLRADVNAHLETQERQRRDLQRLSEEISRLRDENAQLRNSHSSSLKGYVTREQLEKVVEQIKELDRKREADKELVLKQIEKLANTPVVVPPPPTIRRPAPEEPAEPPKRDTPHSRRKDKDKDADADDKPAGKSNASEKSSEKSGATADSGSGKEKSGGSKSEKADDGPELPAGYFEHTVAEGDTIGAIIAAYNKQHGLKVRLAHVLKANPKLKPERLRIGQKIKIPEIK